jgi:hypothetical protein
MACRRFELHGWERAVDELFFGGMSGATTVSFHEPIVAALRSRLGHLPTGVPATFMAM